MKLEFLELVKLYEVLDTNSKRLVKVDNISKLLSNCSQEDLSMVVLLLQGKVFSSVSMEKIGIASSMAIKTISSATGYSEKKVIETWKKYGDLGECAKELCSKKGHMTLSAFTNDTESLSVKDVFESIKKLASITKEGSVKNKVMVLVDLLTKADGIEAKYLIRLFVGDLRVGVGDGALRDSLVWAFLRDEVNIIYDGKDNLDVVSKDDRDHYNEVCKKVMHGFHMVNDFTEVAIVLKNNGLSGLDSLKLTTFHPVQVMLAQKANDIDDAILKVGSPCMVEYKFDGFRVNVHKLGNKIELYTRRMENVTKQFPDIVTYFENYKDDFILDAEVVGIEKNTNKYLPFQHISKRIRRKYDIEEIVKEIPVCVFCFDLLLLNGDSLLDKTQKERREFLERVVNVKENEVELTPLLETDSQEEAMIFYDKSLKEGNEGVMFKSFDKKYQPGSRVGHWVKFKPVMQELDLVITRAQHGEGKRAGWFSSFTVGCQNEEGEILELGNVGTGMKEKTDGDGVSFEELTNLLRPLVLSDTKKEVIVKPKIVVEIAYEEIQKSENYSAGYALRFPRLKRLRNDERDANDIEDIEVIEQLYFDQRGRNS